MVVAVLIAADSADFVSSANWLLPFDKFFLSKGTIGHDVTSNHYREKKVMADDDEAVSSSDDFLGRIDLLPEGWISATITEIMESWPLQLRVSTDSKDLIVELAIDAVIESAVGTLSPGDLSPGDQVKLLIESDSAQPDVYHVVRVKKQ